MKYYEVLTEDFTGGQGYKECGTKDEALKLMEMLKGFKSTAIVLVYEREITMISAKYEKIAEYRSYEFGNLTNMQKLHIKSYMESGNEEKDL